MKQYLDFTGQVVIVTGARSGIGAGCAKAFAEQGAQVVVTGRTPCDKTVAAIEEAGGKACYIQCDVSNEESVINLMNETVEKFGRIDVLVNSAGVNATKVPLVEQTVADYERINDTDAKGIFMCMKYALPTMLEQGKGAIVNIASIAGMIADPNMSPYVGAKHAVTGLTKACAIDYAQQGIRCNCICPGLIHTEMTQVVVDNPEIYERVTSYNLMKRIGEPIEIATVAMFLASDMSSFMTGAILPVEAGQYAH